VGRAKILAGVVTTVFMLTLVGWFSGCTGERALVVASKNFTEQVILGEIIAQHLEHRLEQPVDRRLNLGGTLLAHKALINGDVDLYPEYTGTALTAVLKQPPSTDPVEVLKTVRREYHGRWGVHWLDPLGFNDTFAIVIRGDEARRENIRTISDAAKRTGGWKMGMGYEFQQRPDGLQGLMHTYGLPLDGSVKTMDLGLLYQALEQGQVNMLAANSTDGLLSVLDVRVLDDDKRYFPPYQAVIAVRQEALGAYPGLEKALRELSGTLTDELMQKLNYEVDGRHRRVEEVAREFLQTAQLLQ
jgi:osmoprotectant transport system substrate-binding protein